MVVGKGGGGADGPSQMRILPFDGKFRSLSREKRQLASCIASYSERDGITNYW